MTISPARNAELADVFALLYGDRPEMLAENAAHAFRLVARGELDPDHLLVARSGGSVVGAVLCQPVPGASAVVWPPRARDNDPAIEDALAAAAIDRAGGAKFIQTFLPPEKAPLAGPLLRAGFRRVTQVWQMRRDASSPLPRLGEDEKSGLTLIPYPSCDPTEFQSVLLRCHDNSLDCPELHRVRTTGELLAGYRDAAPDPGRWWLARRGGRAEGVLILGGDDLSFVGVVPERRGRGVGRALIATACAASPGLSLIVDVRNTPAVRLYEWAGFIRIGARDVFLFLPDAAADVSSLPVGRL